LEEAAARYLAGDCLSGGIAVSPCLIHAAGVRRIDGFVSDRLWDARFRY
jgi:hypothetical protein